MLFRRKARVFQPARASGKSSPITKIPIDTGSKFSPAIGYSGPGSLPLQAQAGKRAFYIYIRDHIPLVSAAVWALTKLCATPQSLRFEGSDSEVKKAEAATHELGLRLLENQYFRGDAHQFLIEQMFTEIFTCGKFCGELIFKPENDGIDFFKTLDPYSVYWRKKNGRWFAFYGETQEKAKPVSRETFYFGTLGVGSDNPAGIEPLSSIPFVVEIEQQFLEDMARSSHNAGFPRLQVKITPPELWQNENEEEYLARVNSYFDNTVDAFKDLEVDQNIFTWNDIEVSVIGGEKSRAFTWKIHREQIIEDVITGMKLFPWVLGRSHGTTKEWVRSQYNLLMQEVDSIQDQAGSFSEWIIQTELDLKKIKAKVNHVFEPNKDPFEQERENAMKTRIENLRNLKEDEVISKEEYQSTLRQKFMQM